MPEQCAPASAREPPFDASAYELAVVSVGYGGCCSVRFPTSAGRHTGQRTSSDERVWRAGDADHPLGDWAGVGTVAPETNRWNPSVSLPETHLETVRLAQRCPMGVDAVTELDPATGGANAWMDRVQYPFGVAHRWDGGRSERRQRYSRIPASTHRQTGVFLISVLEEIGLEWTARNFCRRASAHDTR